MQMNGIIAILFFFLYTRVKKERNVIAHALFIKKNG